jgi:hypothetical protein
MMNTSYSETEVESRYETLCMADTCNIMNKVNITLRGNLKNEYFHGQYKVI